MAAESIAPVPAKADDLEIPLIFVPHGAPEPTERMAAHPGWVKFPAVFVPHGWREAQEADAAGLEMPLSDRTTAPGGVVLARADVPETGMGEQPGTLAAAPGRYVAENPDQWVGQTSVGTGECVPLVQAATGAPRSALWRQGVVVQGNTNIRPGTAIATFDSQGHYTGHAAIYLGQDATGIRVIDQWNNWRGDHIGSQHQPSQRTLHFNQPWRQHVDRGEFYSVVQ